MPLKPKYEKIKRAMISKYGKKKGEQVFYAWCNKEGVNPDVKSIFDIASEPLTFFTDETAFSEINTKGDKKYYVTGYISTSDLDSVNDIVTKECLMDMVKQLKSRTIKLDIEHEAYRKDPTIVPIGKITEAKLDEKGIWIKAELNRHSSRFKEVWGSIQEKMLDAFSITFKPLQHIDKEINGITTRMLYAIKLLNVALTGNPANEMATMTGAFTKSLDLIKEDKKMANGDEEEQPKEGEEQPDTSEAKKSAEEVEVVEKKDLKSLSETIESLKEEVNGIKESIEKQTETKDVKEKLEADIKVLTDELADIKKKLAEPVIKATAPDTFREKKGVAVKEDAQGMLSLVR